VGKAYEGMGAAGTSAERQAEGRVPKGHATSQVAKAAEADEAAVWRPHHAVVTSCACDAHHDLLSQAAS